MDRLDDLLASELRRVAGTAAVWDDPVARVGTATAAARRRRIALLATACVLVGVVGIAAAVPRHRASSIGPAGTPLPGATSSAPPSTPETTQPASPTPRVTDTAAPPPATRTPHPSPTPTPTPSPTPMPTESQPPAPYGPGMEIGREYRYDLYTHCGIEYAHFDGREWRTDPQGDGANPPAGWGNPSQPGVVVLLARDRAEFRGDNDKTLVFTPTSEQPPPCM